MVEAGLWKSPPASPRGSTSGALRGCLDARAAKATGITVSPAPIARVGEAIEWQRRRGVDETTENRRAGRRDTLSRTASMARRRQVCRRSRILYAGFMSVWPKSLPLNKSGSPVAFARA